MLLKNEASHSAFRYITVDAYLSAIPFYLKNGFVNQGYIIEEFGVAYDMLGCSSTKVLKAEFKELIRDYFGNWFFNKIYVKNSNIEE